MPTSKNDRLTKRERMKRNHTRTSRINTKVKNQRYLNIAMSVVDSTNELLSDLNNRVKETTMEIPDVLKSKINEFKIRIENVQRSTNHNVKLLKSCIDSKKRSKQPLLQIDLAAKKAIELVKELPPYLDQLKNIQNPDTEDIGVVDRGQTPFYQHIDDSPFVEENGDVVMVEDDPVSMANDFPEPQYDTIPTPEGD